MSKLTDFIGGAGAGLLQNAETITGATGTVALDFSDNKAYIITQGAADLTLSIASEVDARNEGVLVFKRDLDFSATFSGIGVYDPESIINVFSVYDSVSFSVTAQDTTPVGIAFNNDGSKMYIVGESNYSVFQYTLSAPFNLSTASYDSVSFSVNAQDTSPVGIVFSGDGSKMYITGFSNKTVFQYTLSTPFNLATASYESVSFSVAGQDAGPRDVAFNSDGSKMYMVGSSSLSIHQYTLSTPFNMSTASYDSVSFSVSAQEATPFGIAFNNDGSKMYILGFSNDTVYQYTLSTPFDLSTASYESVSFSVAAQDTSPAGIAFNNDGSKMYMLGLTNDSVYQYSVSPTSFSTVHVLGNYKTLTTEYAI